MDHSFFIWSAYGSSALVLLWTALNPLFKQRRALLAIRQLEHGTQSGQMTP